jgi:putative glutamine amidotransferase
MDMHRPFIAVPADARDFGGIAWHAVQQTYLRASLDVAGVLPLIVPACGAERFDLDRLLEMVDGVLLTGSRSNVDPALYGADANEKHGPFDRDRDATTLPLICKALDKGIPLLAICRGMQELNVALGGTLAREIQEIEGNLDHYPAGKDSPEDERYALRHPVEIRPDGCLAGLVGTGRIEVNSLHRQGIDRLAEGLAIEAVAPDGVVEAVSVREARAFALATQWHPEYWAGTDLPSTRIFEAFGKAVRAHHAARTGISLAAE